MKSLSEKRSTTQAGEAETSKLPEDRTGRADPTPVTAADGDASRPHAGTGATGADHERQFLVSTFRDGEITAVHLTARQVLALNADDVDFHWNQVHGDISIRTPDGGPEVHHGGIPGLGPDTGLPLLDAVLWAEGELLTERRLGGSLPYRWDNRKARDRQVSRLRRAFGDSALARYYFIVASCPWRIGWNRARSWRIVERRG